MDGDGIKKVCELLTVHVNVKTKKMTKAMFDDEEITGRQVSTRGLCEWGHCKVDPKLTPLFVSIAKVAAILFYYNLSANHVKIHSMANWGLNSEESVHGVNSFLYRNSIVTASVHHMSSICRCEFP